MTITMSSATLPVLKHYLRVLSDLLDKAEAHALARNTNAAALLDARLYPNMHPLIAQVQFACDFAKGAVARLGGIENPAFPDDEVSFLELHARIDNTLSFIGSVDPAAIDVSATRPISLRFGRLDLSANGRDYALGFAIPSFLFHVSVAYALLRHNGVEIGKLDFLGAVPGMTGLPATRQG